MPSAIRRPPSEEALTFYLERAQKLLDEDVPLDEVLLKVYMEMIGPGSCHGQSNLLGTASFMALPRRAQLLRILPQADGANPLERVRGQAGRRGAAGRGRGALRNF